MRRQSPAGIADPGVGDLHSAPMLFDPLKLLQRLWGLCTNPRILLFAALQLTLATALGLLCALLALPQLWYIWPE